MAGPTDGGDSARWVLMGALRRGRLRRGRDARRDLRATRWAGLGAAGGPPKTAGLLSGARGPPDDRDFEPDKDPDGHNARRIDDLFAGLLEQ